MTEIYAKYKTSDLIYELDQVCDLLTTEEAALNLKYAISYIQLAKKLIDEAEYMDNQYHLFNEINSEEGE